MIPLLLGAAGLGFIGWRVYRAKLKAFRSYEQQERLQRKRWDELEEEAWRL